MALPVTTRSLPFVLTPCSAGTSRHLVYFRDTLAFVDAAVIVQVEERLPQYLDIQPGFSTGDGFRIQFEYGHRNVAGKAMN